MPVPDLATLRPVADDPSPAGIPDFATLRPVHVQRDPRVPDFDTLEEVTPQTMERRFADPFYEPTIEEFRVYREGQKDEPWFQPGKWAGIAGASVMDLGGIIGRGAKALARNPGLGVMALPNTGLPTEAEGAARGTFDIGMMGRAIAGNTLGKIATYAQDMAAEQFKSPEEFENYKLQRDYDRFLIDRVLAATRERARRGEENLLPISGVNSDVAEAASLVLDPTLAIPGAAGVKIPGRLAAGSAKGLGRVAETLGRGARQIAEKPGAYLESKVAAAEGTPFQSFVKGKAALLEAAPATAAGVAGGVEAVGQAAQAIGEKAAAGPSQFGIFEQIAKDATKPPWLRKSSRIASRLGAGKALEAGAALGGGAIEGMAIGGVLGLAADGMEGAASGIGSGGVLGAAGGLANRIGMAPARRREGEEADIGRFLLRQAELGTSPDQLAKLNRETALAAATADQIFGGDVDIRFVNQADYGKLSKDSVGAAFFTEIPNAKSQLVVNLDAFSQSTGSNFLHELGHALFKSPVVNKSEIASALYSVYGEGSIGKMADEYARKLLVNRRFRAESSLFRGDVPPLLRERTAASIKPDDVQALKSELTAQDPDWFVGEIFAEHFLDTTFDQSMNRLRKGALPKGASSEGLLGALVQMKARVLSTLGVPLDANGSGRIAGGADRLFQENPIRQDAKLQRMIVNYLRDRDRFLSGLQVAKDRDAGGARVTASDLKEHPAAGWQWNPKAGLFENEFGVKLPSGEVVLKPAKAVAAAEAKRVEDLKGLFPEGNLDPSDPRVGPKTNAGGVKEIRGRVLPDGFFQLESFGEDTKRAVRELQDAMEGGGVFNAWYQAIGTGQGNDTWAASVRKGLGNMRVQQRDFKPLGFQVSKVGNLLVTLLDVTSTLRKAVRWQTEGKLAELWGGDLNNFRSDMERYLKNHADGQPGDANGVGLAKRNKLNSFFATDLQNTKANPLRAELRGDDKKSLVKSFRVDRIQNLKRTAGDYWFDYQKQKQNLLPDTDAKLRRK